MRFHLLAFTLSIAFVAITFGQIDFDSPEVIQTSFTRQESGQTFTQPTTSSCNCSSNSWSGNYSAAFGDSYCDSCFGGSDIACGDSGCGAASRWGLTVSGIIDIALDGVFHTGDDARINAAALGVPPAIYLPATPFDLLINEQGFDDIYDTLGGVQNVFLDFTGLQSIILNQDDSMTR